MTETNPHSSPRTIEPAHPASSTALPSAAGVERFKTCLWSLLLSVLILAWSAWVLDGLESYFAGFSGNWMVRLSSLPVLLLVVLPSGLLMLTISMYGAWNGIFALSDCLPNAIKAITMLFVVCHVILIATPILCLAT